MSGLLRLVEKIAAYAWWTDRYKALYRLFHSTAPRQHTPAKNTYAIAAVPCVTVLGSEPQADGGSYPRVVESRGEAPPQYHAYDEE